MTAPLSGSSHPVLTEDFPYGVSVPKYAIGDRVRFAPMPAEDYGIITGLQFAPAEHLQDWAWRYVVWLDERSPSRQWIGSDLAWEDDLQLLVPATAALSPQEQPA